MLRDPHYDLNIRSFRDFAANQQANESYEYSSRLFCACAQFAERIGLFEEWYAAELSDGGPWARLNLLARDNTNHTWGELLQRIDAEIASVG